MSWLKLDDGFVGNAKIAALTDREFRIWVRTLCYCARAKDPTVDRMTIREVAGLTPKLASKYASLLLLDFAQKATPISYEIHDWIKYLPKDATGAERQSLWRSRRRNQANIDQVSTVTETVTPTVTEGVTKTPKTRARADLPVPVPVLKSEDLNPRSTETAYLDTPREPADAATIDRISKEAYASLARLRVERGDLP